MDVFMGENSSSDHQVVVATIATTTAEVLVKEWFFRYGILSRIHSDQGQNFESEVIAEFLGSNKIKKSYTTLPPQRECTMQKIQHNNGWSAQNPPSI